MKRLGEEVGFKGSLNERGKTGVLRRFGHIERIEGERLVKKISSECGG